MNIDPVAAEVRDLHRFIQSWFNGTVPKSPETFERLARAWPEGFTLVAPDHARRTSKDLLASNYAQHGQFPSLSIEIRRLDARTNDGVAVAMYEEWHIDRLHTEARACSATFAVVGTQLRWIHVHESPLADGHAD